MTETEGVRASKEPWVLAGPLTEQSVFEEARECVDRDPSLGVTSRSDMG